MSRLFRLPAKPPIDGDVGLREVDREVIEQHSHGNILLQCGSYYVKEDVENEKEELRQFA